MVRRVFVALLVAVLVIALTGCSKANEDGSAKLRVLATTYPMFLFTRAVVGDTPGVSVDLLLSPDVGCPHDYMVTPQDMQRLSSADVLVMNGAGLDNTFAHAAQRAKPEVALIDSSAGMRELIKQDEHDEDGDEDGHHHDHGSVNPHVFADPRMAAIVVANIGKQLSAIYPAGEQNFTKNANAYAVELNKLADEFAAAGETFQNRKIVTQHAVFDYLARTAGLEIVAVIQGEPGQAASPADRMALIQKIKSSGAAAIFIEPQYSDKEARAIAAEPGVSVQVATLDPVATGPADPPSDYYVRTMRANLGTLKRVLDRKD